MKPLRWTTTQESHEYMAFRKKQNLESSKTNRNENWFYQKLRKTPLKWKRQSQWGYRIFDFWCYTLGVAIEIDGNEHNKKYDAYRDEYNFRRSAVIVLRVRNKNEEDAYKVLLLLNKIENWDKRKKRLGISWENRKVVRKIAKQTPDNVSMLNNYLDSMR